MTKNNQDYIDPIIQNNLWDPLPPMEQITTDKGRWYELSTDSEKKPYYSVTTIIQASKTVAAKRAIEDWKRAEIKEGRDPDRFSRDGDVMHNLIEYYYKRAYELPPLEMCKGRGYQLFKQYKEGYLSKVHVVPHLIEGRVYNEVDGMAYAGTIDLVATIQEEPGGEKQLALIDHKSISNIKNASSKRKGYIPQLAAYAKAIKDKYNITIDVAILNFASTKSFKSYKIDMKEILEQWDQFYYKLAAFYDKGVFPNEQV